MLNAWIMLGDVGILRITYWGASDGGGVDDVGHEWLRTRCFFETGAAGGGGGSGLSWCSWWSIR